jgi:hypothetical protein
MAMLLDWQVASLVLLELHRLLLGLCNVLLVNKVSTQIQLDFQVAKHVLPELTQLALKQLHVCSAMQDSILLPQDQLYVPNVLQVRIKHHKGQINASPVMLDILLSTFKRHSVTHVQMELSVCQATAPVSVARQESLPIFPNRLVAKIAHWEHSNLNQGKQCVTFVHRALMSPLLEIFNVIHAQLESITMLLGWLYVKIVLQVRQQISLEQNHV